MVKEYQKFLQIIKKELLKEYLILTVLFLSLTLSEYLISEVFLGLVINSLIEIAILYYMLLLTHRLYKIYYDTKKEILKRKLMIDILVLASVQFLIAYLLVVTFIIILSLSFTTMTIIPVLGIITFIILYLFYIYLIYILGLSIIASLLKTNYENSSIVKNYFKNISCILKRYKKLTLYVFVVGLIPILLMILAGVSGLVNFGIIVAMFLLIIINLTNAMFFTIIFLGKEY